MLTSPSFYGSLFLIRISEAVWVCVIRRAQGWGRGESKLDSEKLAGNFVTQRRTGDPSKSHGISAPVLLLNRGADYLHIGITSELFRTP